ncbi:hypothetical protein JMUB6875_01490 [Nocardia sp. JMUB6875]
MFAGYRIDRKLGAGGMGSVFLAQHPRLPRQVALKVLAESANSDDEFRARFLREAELAARLAHPNVVGILDRGVFEDSLWIAMQFIDGSDAAQLLRTAPSGLPPERAVHIVVEAARGLDAAHAAGLLHRDVKPANLLVAPGAEGRDRVLVTDFGIARAMGESTTLTAAGDVLATIAYAAPEQLRGETLDPRTDVYALGATLHQLLTGTTPFPRSTAAAVMHAHLTEPPPRPNEVNPAVPPRFDAVIARAMAKHPEERYRSCGDLAAAAAAALRGEAVRGTSRFSGRRRRLVVAAAAFLVPALAVGPIYGLRSPDSAPGGAAAPTDSAIADDGSGPWGVAGFMVAAFPRLLPRSPLSSSAQGLWCEPTSEKPSDALWNMAPLDVRTENFRLTCISDGDPVEFMWVDCLTSRLPMPEGNGRLLNKKGEQDWTRPSGTGHISWSDTTDAFGRVDSSLRITFDDPGRNFCKITVFGLDLTGQQMLDTWWPNAPL